MKSFLVSSAPLFFLTLCSAWSQDRSAVAIGTVVDEANHPVPGARITYLRQPAMKLDSKGRWRATSIGPSIQTTTDATGNFRMADLAAGDYDVCIQARGHLTNCEWSQWHRVRASSAKVSDQGKIQLVKAATVSIRIDDPAKIMGVMDPSATPLVIAVRDELGRFHRAHRVSQDGMTHILEVNVPYDTPLALWIHSAVFVVTDSSGTRVPQIGREVPFKVPPADAPPTYWGGPLR